MKLWAVSALEDNQIQVLELFKEQEKALQRYIKLCKSWYKDDLLIEFSSKKVSEMNYYDFEEYKSSDQFGNNEVANISIEEVEL